jgi:glucose-6-phosphate 1-dehydrogenase
VHDGHLRRHRRLTRRKLLPALYRLTQQRLIPNEFVILGTARQPLGDDEFRSQMQAALTEFGGDSLDESTGSFAKRIFYIAGDLNDAELYAKLKTKVEEIDKEFTPRATHFLSSDRAHFLD